MPHISVIVPVYNVEKYLHRCVDSILAQTFSDFELILVDDGSTDNCGKICDEYAKKDNRIHVIHKDNGGLSDARNAGIDWAFANSDSEWITFIDSDDWIHPKYLEALYKAAEETGCKISISGYEETTGNSPVVEENSLLGVTVNTEDFFCEHNVNAVIACAKLYKKVLFKEIRYPIGKLHEDEFTTYKVLFKNDTCAFIDQPLYYYFYNIESIMKSKWTPKRLDAIEALYSRMGFFQKHHFLFAYQYTVIEIAKYFFYQLNRDILMDYPKIKKQLFHKLRFHLLTKRVSIKEVPYCYELVFPHYSKWYWRFISRVENDRRNN